MSRWHDEVQAADTDDPATWFVPLTEDEQATRQIFGFPNAGAGPSALMTCAQVVIRHGIQMWSVNLPGREARFLDPVESDLETLVTRLTGELTRVARAPFALFGYCSGALLAYLVTRRLVEHESLEPCHLFVVGYPPPDVPNRSAGELITLEPEEFWRRMVRLGGIPPDIAALPDARLIFEPSLRADYTLIAQYEHSSESALPVPITVLGAAGDGTLSISDLAGWATHTSSSTNIRVLNARRWPLTEASDEVGSCIAMTMGSSPHSRGASARTIDG